MMSFNLRNRSLLTVQDYTPREFRYLLDLARDLKRAKYARTEQKHLQDKEICLIFEKTSTRTRCAFEVACYDQGAHVTYLDPAGSQIGHKESFRDTARVLGRMYDAIEYRGASQEGVEPLAKYAGVPVFTERGRVIFLLKSLRKTSNAVEPHRKIANALPPKVAAALQPTDLERIRQHLNA